MLNIEKDAPLPLKIFSLTLMMFGVLLLIILSTHNILDVSLNSTSIYKNPSLTYEIRNIIADFLLQMFGITIYVLPIVMIIWSYKIYIGNYINFPGVKLIALLYILIVSPALVSTISEYQGGVLGMFLAQHITLFQDFDYIFLIINTLIMLFILSISYKQYVFFVVLIYKALKYGILYIKNFIITNIKNKKPKKVKKQSDTILKITPDLDFIRKQHEIQKNIIGEEVFEKYIPNQISTKKEVINNKVAINISKSSGEYFLPLEFLTLGDSTKAISTSSKEIKDNAIILEQTINEFGINGKIVNIKTGPIVTLYEVNIPAGVKTTKLISLEADIALRMKAISIRVAIVPGKDVIGVEIPNKSRKIVYLRDILQRREFSESSANLPLILGVDVNGKSIVTDLAAMPHVLIAGTTGSGKSVGINAMILSLLYKLSPQQCKLIMIDPKMLELSVYQDIPHLITPVVIDPKKSVAALKWAVKEMEGRYYKMSLLSVRNITGYNDKIRNEREINEIKEDLQQNQNIDISFDYMPYIVIVIDEMADLMLVAGKEVEMAVQRLAQMARASGIHLIMATQRPSVDVITGTIKANFPTRISFQVSSKIDSRTILSEQGAEQLLGKGDMLYMAGVGRLQRVHGPFISDNEVSKVVEYLHKMGKPNYIESVTSNNIVSDNGYIGSDKDELYEEVIAIIQKEKKISTSFLQRKFQIGYNRAARLVEQLEENGIISKPNHNGKRDILV